jgi:hypothetical protein
MELHFCDLCNESVPQTDLDRGNAFIRKGRVVCATCEGLMSHPDGSEGTPPGANRATAEPPRPAPNAEREARRAEQVAIAGGGSTGALLAGLLAIAAMMLVAGVALILIKRIDSSAGAMRTDLNKEVTDLTGSLNDLEGRVNERGEFIAGTLGAVQERLDGLSDDVRDVVGKNAEAVRALREDLGAVEAGLASLDGLAARVASGEASQAAMGAQLEQMRDDVATLSAAMIELEDLLVGMPVAPPPGVGEPGPGAPPWMGLVDDLASPNSGTRYNAVQALGETGDAAVVPHLTPMLKDEDLFVRMASARYLGELQSPAAIPALIDTLEDVEPSVRDAAVTSLRDLSARNFKFDPSAPESDRAKKVKAWRDWWKKAEGEFLGGDAG